MQIILPKSGYTVDINEDPSTGQTEDLDDFVENHTNTVIDEFGKPHNTLNKTLGEIKREQTYLTLFTFTNSIKDKDGKDLPLTRETVRALKFADSEVWKKAAFKAQVDLKKN